MRLKDRIKTFSKSSVARLSVSAIFAQAVSVLTAPVLSRLYSPSDFGTSALFGTITGYITTVACMSYQTGMASQESEDRADRLLLASIYSLVSITFAIFVILYVTRSYVFGAIKAPQLEQMVYVFPLAVIMSGSYSLLSGWATRRRLFDDIASTRISQSVAGALTGISIGILKLGPIGLITNGIVSGSWGVRRLWKTYSRMKCSFVSASPFDHVKWAFSSNKEIVLFGTLQMLVNSMGVSLPVLFIGAYYTSEDVGYFSLASRMVSLPMTLLGAAIAQDMLGRFSSTYFIDKEQAITLWYRTAYKLRLVAAVVALFCLGLPWVIPIVFGHRWVGAGTMALAMGLFAAVQMMVSPLSSVVFVLRKQKQHFWLDLGRMVITTSVFILCARAGYTASVCVSVYAVCMAFCYLGYLTYYRYLISNATMTRG